jgi:hypothetical protein
VAALTLAAVVLAFLGASRAALVGSARRLSDRESVFLVLGAALLCGCFFAGQSVIYRGMYFLFVLPSLFTMARAQPFAWARRLIRAACGLVVLVLWMPVWEYLLGKVGLATPPTYQPENVLDAIPDAPFGIALWLVNELSWWFLITVLLSTAGACLCAATPFARTLWRALPGIRGQEDAAAR